MTLQKAIYFLMCGLFAVGMLSMLAALIGIGINVFTSITVNVSIGVFVYGGCLALRFVLSIWLKRLGGVPQEFRKT